MLFFNIWAKVLHLLVHMFLTQVTPAQTDQKPAIRVVVCDQSACIKWRWCGEQMETVGSSSLELQMPLANLATSIVAPAAKTFRCWRMAHMKSWDTFMVSSILRVTTNRDWRQLAGGSWTLKETPSVRVRWSAAENAFFEVFWSFGIESIPLPRIWLLTILEPRMPRCQSLLRCRRWLKCCNWAAPTSWFTNCGHNSTWLPAVWTLTWHGVTMRCWLVFFLFHVSTFPCALAYWCCVLVDQFE